MKQFFFGFTLWVWLVPTAAMAEISYIEILKDPDNVELNRQYALERIQAQDIKPALSAIERVIQAEPLDLGARLIRAQILISLGDYALAQSELELLARLKLPAEQSDLVTKLLQESRNAKKRLFISGQLSHSFSYNDNVGGHTDSGLIADVNGNTAGNFFTDAEGHSSQTSDLFNTTQLKLNFLYDLNNQDKDSVYLDLTTSKTNGSSTNISDGIYNKVTIGSYLNTQGINNNLYLSYAKNNKKNLVVNNQTVIQDKQETVSLGLKSTFQIQEVNIQTDLLRETTNFSNRGALSDASDATTSSFSVNGLKPISYTTAIYANVNYAERRASDPTIALASESQNRDTRGIGFGLIHTPATGQRVTLNTSLQNHKYKIRNQLSDQYLRKDNELLASIAYSLDGSLFPKNLSSLKVDFLLSHSRVMSNMPTYDVTTNSFTILGSYPFSL